MQALRSSRRRMLAQSAGTGFLALSPWSWAQSKYPSKGIRVVVPFGAGGGTDIVARNWGERIAKATGQSVVIENKPGASTIIGTQNVATSPADGYNLLYTVVNTFSINPFVYTKLPYKADDFVPVIRIATIPYVLIVSAESKVKTVQELIALAKAKPGNLSYGHYGTGQGTHLAVVRFLNAAGISMNAVPYKDSAITDLVAERLDLLADASSVVIPHVKGGKVRALAIMGAQRIDALPGVPTLAETFPGFASDSWHGVFAPKGTPDEVVATLASLSRGIVESADFRNRLHDVGLIPVGGTTADFQKFLSEDARAWAKVVKDNNIKVE